MNDADDKDSDPRLDHSYLINWMCDVEKQKANLSEKQKQELFFKLKRALDRH